MQICRQLPIRKIALNLLACSVFLFLLAGCKQGSNGDEAPAESFNESWSPIRAEDMRDLPGTYLVEGGRSYVVIGTEGKDYLEVRKSLGGSMGMNLTIECRGAEIRLTESVFESDIIYSLRKSSTVPGDWDLVGIMRANWPMAAEKNEYFPLETPLTSYLHRVDDPKVIQYFKGLPESAEEAKIWSISGEMEQTAIKLLNDHPDDPYIRGIYLDYLTRSGRIVELEAKIALWREDFLRSGQPFVEDMLRYAEESLAAQKCSAEGRNAKDSVLRLLGSSLETRLDRLPEIRAYDKFLEGASVVGLHYHSISFLELQMLVKISQIQVCFELLLGRRGKALDLCAAVCYLAQIMARDGSSILGVIGMNFRTFAYRSLGLYALNACETPDEFEALWKTLEFLEKSQRDLTTQEFMSTESALDRYTEALSVSRSMGDPVVRNRAENACFQTIRMAVAARYRQIKDGRFPTTSDELAPLLPDGPPMDPFAKGPMRFTSTPYFFTCYSVGPDGQDNEASIEYDPRNGTVSRGDILLRVPFESQYPFPRNGVRARTAEDLRRQFPNGLPKDPFRIDGQLSVSNTTPVFVYSYGPDQVDSTGESAGSYIPWLAYDPTNGTMSDGDIFIQIPEF